jgi:hypothetical protein
MDRHETAAKLSTLIRLAETAEETYILAAPRVPDPHVARTLARIACEHGHQAEEIRDVLTAMGEPQRERSADFESYTHALIAGAARAERTGELIGRARQAEAACLVQYADAAETQLPLQAGRLVRRHLARNEGHLDWIDRLCEGSRA